MFFSRLFARHTADMTAPFDDMTAPFHDAKHDVWTLDFSTFDVIGRLMIILLIVILRLRASKDVHWWFGSIHHRGGHLFSVPDL